MTSLFGIFFGVALVVALSATPLVRQLGLKLQVMDQPGIRKVHDRVVTRVGGLAIFLAVLAGAAAMVLVRSQAGRSIREEPREWLVLLGGALLVFGVGFLDDLRGLLPRGKLLVQAIAAVLLCAFDIRVESIEFTPTYTLELGIWSWPLTILWVVGITNAINLIDGLDGLAGGIAIMAALAIAWTALELRAVVQPGDTAFIPQATAGLAVILAGALFGFLFFNFNPARIYMGDGGSLLIGFLLAALSIQIRDGAASLASLGVPAFFLGVPIFDTLYSMLRRISERRSPFAADKGHIHHRLLERGFRPVQVVMLLYAVTLATGGLSLLLLLKDMQGVKSLLVVVFDLLLIVLLFRLMGHVRIRRTFDALKRVAEVGRDQKESVRAFEDLQLHFREAKSFEGWWQLVCRAADEMGFQAVAMETGRREAGEQMLSWRREGVQPPDDEVLSIHLPVKQRREGGNLKAQIDVHCTGSMESVGQRFALFARLLDECSLADLGG
ncbi:MAG: glycosyltransferase family 4 protein [Planctomycetota bacterium]